MYMHDKVHDSNLLITAGQWDNPRELTYDKLTCVAISQCHTILLVLLVLKQ